MERQEPLIIRDDEMSWYLPSWRSQIKMIKPELIQIKNAIIKKLKPIGKIIGKIFSWMALPLLIAVLYAMLWPMKYPADKPKYIEMTTVELLDYYQAKAQEFKNGRK